MDVGAAVVLFILILVVARVAVAAVAGIRGRRAPSERRRDETARLRAVPRPPLTAAKQERERSGVAERRTTADVRAPSGGVGFATEFPAVPGAGSGKTELMHWAAIGDESRVRELLDRGDRVDAVDHDGDGVLRYAMGNRNLRLFELLLARGADANARSTSASGIPGLTILHALAESGWAEGIAALGRHGVMVEARGAGGVTATMLAAGGGHDGALIVLRGLGADVNAVDDDGDSVLYYAASRGRGKTTGLLLSLGADANPQRRPPGQTPLMVAAILAGPGTRRPPGTSAADFERCVIELLRAGADPTAMYDAGYALQRAADGGLEIPSVDRARQAVQGHDDWGVVYVTPEGRGTLWNSPDVRDPYDPEAMRARLMAENASIDNARAEQRAFESRSLIGEFYAQMGQFGLHYVETAAEVRSFLAAGAPIDGTTKIDYGDAIQHWETPLLTALVDGRWDVARELIRSGANVDAPNAAIFANGAGFAHSALHMMIQRSDHDAVQALITAGADVNRQTTLGSTPLHFAATVDDPELVILLLDAGARPQIPDLEGKLPAEAAGARTSHLFS